MATTTVTAVRPLVLYDINVPYADIPEEVTKRTKYPDYLPTFDKVWYDPLPYFPYEDPALRVKDKTKPNLLGAGVKLQDIQPKLGSIVHGVQLNQLSDAGKDELALLIAERKVLAFPDQDLIDAGPARQEEFMKYFGKLEYQPVSGTVRGHPGFHIIHRDGNKDEIENFFQQKTTSCLWHQDVSFEKQPPGYVMLGLLQGPEVGGDTVFAATDDAYGRLSPTFTALLDNLKTVHTSAKMAAHTRLAGKLVRKDPIDTIHPLVRIHPVTGKKCIFVSGEFITHIVGMKDPESKLLLEFLVQHMVTCHDIQARVRWQPRTIVMFDNRSTIHSASMDYSDHENGAKARHIFRLCAMTEIPIVVS